MPKDTDRKQAAQYASDGEVEEFHDAHTYEEPVTGNATSSGAQDIGSSMPAVEDRDDRGNGTAEPSNILTAEGKMATPAEQETAVGVRALSLASHDSSYEDMEEEVAAAYRAPSLQVQGLSPEASPNTGSARAAEAASSQAQAAVDKAKYPLHRAVFDGQIAIALDLIKAMTDEERQSLDPQGNTVLHVAVLRRRVAVLLALLDAGIPPNLQNSHRWTPLDEAVSLKDKGMVMLLHARETATMKADLKAKKGDLLRSLTEMPDYSFQLKWELGSPVLGLLLRKYAPNDTYEVWKMGTKMRVDGSLMGLDDKRTSLLPQWKRGHFSLLFDGSTTPATLLLCDHTKKKYLDLSKEKKKHKPSLEEEASMIISEGAGRTKMRASEFRFKVVKTWLGNESTERIEGWKTRIFEAAGKMAAVTVNKSPFEVPAKATWEDYLALEPKEDVVTEVPIDPYSMDSSPGKPIKQKGAEVEDSKKKKPKQARRLTGRCWMAEDFPMSLKQLLPVLDVIGNANKHIARVGKFLQKYGDMSLFPVKLQIPLIYTVYALISFRQFKTLGESTNAAAKLDSWYTLPAGYTLKTFEDIAEKRNRRSLSWDEAETAPANVEGSDAEILAQMGL